MPGQLKIISTSYSKTESFSDPELWLARVSFYTGILGELAKRHTVISIERINHAGTYKRNGVEYWFIDLKRKISRFPWRMHRQIKTAQPDVVLVNGLVFPLQLIQLRLTIRKKAKIIVLHRSEKPFNGLKRYLQKLADKCVDAYLFTSAEFGSEWEKNISVNRIYEVVQASSIFKPADKVTAREKLNVEGSPVFLWVGNLIPRKDPVTVVKAFLEFLMYHPTASLYMIWQTGELLEEIKNLSGGNKAIHLTGKTAHSELEHWYNSADFIIAGSHHEGSGVAVIEAMSCGCIPVLTSIPSFKRMTGPGKGGLLYEPGNINELVQVLLKAKEMNMPVEREKVLQQFSKELSFEAIAREIENVIDLLDKKNASGE